MPLIKKPRSSKLLLKKVSAADTRISVDEKTFTILQQIAIEADQLPDKETRELWLDAVQTFAQTGDLNNLVSVCEWRRRVVPIDEFLFSPTFLAMDEREIYPSVLEALHDLDSDQYIEAILKGAIGTGKTTIGNIYLARALYKLSCMRHPQTTFGVQSKSSLVFTIQSVRLNTAKKAVFEELGRYINPSPYFRYVYPYDHKVISQMIFREQNISILPVTSATTGAISLNVIGGILDEVNYMQQIEKSKSSYAELDGSFHQAKMLYNTLARRRRSRFTRKGKLPGILFLISSSRYPDDFTEEKAAESIMCGGPDPQIFVYSHSQWSAKGRDVFLNESFKVQVGNDRIRSRVLREGELHDPSCQAIEIPMDFYNEFVKDTDGSLRDYAGVTTLATHPFIGRRDSIYECMQDGEKAGYSNILNVEEIDLSLGIPKPVMERIRSDGQFRSCHVDLGLKRDACGIAIGHIAGTKIIERRNPETNTIETEILPVIGLDLVLRVVPPPNGEIEFANIRKLITLLRDQCHIDIRYVTFDGFQSVDSRQILKNQGFQTDYYSVEKIETYRSLRDALYDRRVLLPKHQILMKELAELEVIIKDKKEKVDHRPQGAKDVADAVCGVVSFLLNRRAAWAGINFRGKTGLQLNDLTAVPQGNSKAAAVMSTSGRKILHRKRLQRKRMLRKPAA